MEGRSVLQKLKLMAEFSPAFLTSLIFKVGSIAIICTLLKEYSAIYMGIGIFLTFVMACYFYWLKDIEGRIGSAIFYSLTNVTILAKCPLGSRKENYKQMLAVSVIWMILHTFTLLVLIIWFGAMDPSTHLPHWSEHRFAFHQNPTLFYTAASAMIVFGPISILSLRSLEDQV